MAAKKYQHIIWDWNGTIIDDAWLCVDVMNGVLARRNMPTITLEKYQEVFDFPVINYYRRLGFDFEEEPFEVSGTEFIVNYEKRRHEISLHPGAKRTLEAVRGIGITQSLLSAYKQETLEELTNELNVRQFFINVVGLDDHYAHSKIESGKKWIAELGSRYDPEVILFGGDTVHDHEVAEAMGVDCILIAGGHHRRERLETCLVPVLDSLPEVVTLLTDNT